MTPKRCSKSGQFLRCSKSKIPAKKQHGGMFAPGAFANMGQAMLDPRGAAPPQETYSSDDEDAQLDMIRELLPRLPEGPQLQFQKMRSQVRES